MFTIPPSCASRKPPPFTQGRLWRQPVCGKPPTQRLPCVRFTAGVNDTPGACHSLPRCDRAEARRWRRSRLRGCKVTKATCFPEKVQLSFGLQSLRLALRASHLPLHKGGSDGSLFAGRRPLPYSIPSLYIRSAHFRTTPRSRISAPFPVPPSAKYEILKIKN